jgi:hypothetical protein
MSLNLQPVRVGTGSDEEGMLVFADDQRLVAVLTHLSDQYGDVSGHCIGIWKQSSACWMGWVIPLTPIWTQPRRVSGSASPEGARRLCIP